MVATKLKIAPNLGKVKTRGLPAGKGHCRLRLQKLGAAKGCDCATRSARPRRSEQPGSKGQATCRLPGRSSPRRAAGAAVSGLGHGAESHAAGRRSRRSDQAGPPIIAEEALRAGSKRSASSGRRGRLSRSFPQYAANLRSALAEEQAHRLFDLEQRRRSHAGSREGRRRGPPWRHGCRLT